MRGFFPIRAAARLTPSLRVLARLWVFAFACGPCTASFPQSKFDVTLPGKTRWIDSGVTVKPGDVAVITASGAIRYAGGKPIGPEGAARGWRDLLRALPVAKGNLGALIGRIGESEASQAFLIGSRMELTAGASGKLFLGINQGARDSATGEFTVRIGLRPAMTDSPDRTNERAEAREVREMPGVTREFFRQYARRVQDAQGTPGDLTNFVVIGTEDTVRKALSTAGWVVVDRTRKDALLRGLLTSLSKQAYVELPMSELMLFDRAQDYGYAHAEPFAVVAQRHHFRLWKAPFTLEGQTVWIGAGTHDIGFDRDQRTGGITHKIDPNVDAEREFIRESLAQTGMVTEFAYATPPGSIQNARTAHGEDFHSDGRVLILRMLADRLDRSRLFAQMFCSVLASHPDSEKWGDCAGYLQSPESASQKLGPLSTKYRLLIVPGVMNTCAQSAPAFDEGQKYLRDQYGLTVDLLAVPNQSAESNAQVIADWLNEQRAKDSRQFIVLGYSKGAPDVQTALALHPHAASNVAAFVSVAGAIGGSPIADVMPGIADRWISSLHFGPCRGNMAEAFRSLKRDVRQTFLRQYPTPAVPSYSLAAVADVGRVSKVLKQTWQLMSAYDRLQDGQLAKSDSLVPGGAYLGTLLADHFAVALPLAKSGDASLQALVDRNNYPRAALLEAIVRFVSQDLESRTPPLKP